MTAKGNRRPLTIPHHPVALTAGLAIAAIAFVVMAAISWIVITGASSVFATGSAESVPEAAADPAAEPVAGTEAAESGGEWVVPMEAAAVDEEGAAGVDPGDVPARSVTTTGELELNPWSVVSADGSLAVAGTITNRGSEELNGTIRIDVFNSGQYLTSAWATVSGFPGGASQRVELVGDGEWEPGAKVLRMEFEQQ